MPVMSPNCRPSEVLKLFHLRSRVMCVTGAAWRDVDLALRLDAIDWLVQAFDGMKIPEVQLFKAIEIFDYVAMINVPAAMDQEFDTFLAVVTSMLLAVKVCGRSPDLDRAKELIKQLCDSPSHLADIYSGFYRLELCTLEQLSFRIHKPTWCDILELLVSNTLPAALSHEWTEGAWAADAQVKCANLARFLLELALVHEPRTVYGPGNPPLITGLAALILALLACRAPQHCIEALGEPLRLLDTSCAVVADVCETMWRRWYVETRGAATSSGSSTTKKWLRRLTYVKLCAGLHGQCPLIFCPTDQLDTQNVQTRFAISHSSRHAAIKHTLTLAMNKKSKKKRRLEENPDMGTVR